MASESLITCESSPDNAGEVIVQESLTGQGQTFLAIIIAIAMVAVAVVLLATDPQRTIENWLVAASVTAGALTLLPLIVQRNWFQTRLVVGPDGIGLTMGGPLGRQRFGWRPHEVDAVCLLPIPTAPGTVPLAEMEIRTADASPIRLFTDHPESELAPIAAAIRTAMRRTLTSPQSAEDVRAAREAERDSTRPYLRAAVDCARDRRRRNLEPEPAGDDPVPAKILDEISPS
jgi:hypothetical protein